MMFRWLACGFAAIVLLASGCSSSDNGVDGGSGGTAGSGGTGGMAGTGGTAGSGGTAGIGGMAGMGGTAGSGGTAGAGGSGGTDPATTFGDATFLDSEWTLIVRTTGLGGSSAASQVGSGGNLDAYRTIEVRHNGAHANRWTCIYALSMKDSALYDPSSGGAIESIDYSEDAIAIESGQRTGPALCQSGDCYISVAGTTTTLVDWSAIQLGRLLAEDFTLIDTSSGVGEGLDDTMHPDFSSSGAVVEFGFYRSICAPPGNFGRSPAQSEAGIDNWTVTVNQAE